MFKSKDDTITAIATPLGEGGLGVVRLSGSRALPIADRIFKSSRPLSDAPSHTLHHGHIYKDDQLLDEAVAALFKAPRSYTGEDVVEFSCHGSPVILKDIVALCVSNGARLAEPGEFTQRAYLNGKMDLLQAEAVAELVHAQSSRAVKAAAQQLNGQLSGRIKSIRDRLVDLLARVEANLDFVEEDIPGLPKEEMKNSLEEARSACAELLATSVRGRNIRQGVRVVFMGRPNVGKSSLFNALLAEDRAIVTNIPGTTRDILEEKMEWNGYPVVLVDTAGLRDSTDEVEKKGTERARSAHGAADVLLFVIDGSAPISAEDRAQIKSVQGKSVVAVVNKADKTVKFETADLKKLGWPVVTTSALNGKGLSELKEKVLASVGAASSRAETEDAPVVSNLRHIESIESAQSHLKNALTALAARKSEEEISVEIKAALDRLGELTGESAAEDVLNSIFRQFCIGK